MTWLNPNQTHLYLESSSQQRFFTQIIAEEKIMNDKVRDGLLIAGIIGLCGVLFAIIHLASNF